jgi:hypothetical protein
MKRRPFLWLAWRCAEPASLSPPSFKKNTTTTHTHHGVKIHCDPFVSSCTSLGCLSFLLLLFLPAGESGVINIVPEEDSMTTTMVCLSTTTKATTSGDVSMTTTTTTKAPSRRRRTRPCTRLGRQRPRPAGNLPLGLFLWVVVLVLPFLVAAAAGGSADDASSIEDEPEPQPQPEESQPPCGLYLATSRAQRVEETTWGIYAGRFYQTGDALGSPELAILLPGVKSYTQHSELGAYLQGLAWSTETVGAQFATDEEQIGGKSVALLPGLGLFAGCYMKKRNTKWNITNAYHAASDDRSSINDAGAETTFFNAQAVATNDIHIGSELFLGCGDDDEDETDEAKDALLTTKEYKYMDLVVKTMMQFFAKHDATLLRPADDNDNNNARRRRQQRQLIYDFFRHDVMKVAVDQDEVKAAKIDRLLPDRVDQLIDIIKAGGAKAYHDPSPPPPDTEWLQAHGMCLDHITMRASNIAGRGVFTTRHLARGSTIAPMPLIHLPNRAVFDMYENNDDDDESTTTQPFHRQLMLNYCYAHAESTMIFCPAGPVVSALNHAKKPNAKLVWSNDNIDDDDDEGNNNNWTPDDAFTTTNLWKAKQYKERIVLMLKLVALEDLPVGTEVTIDYGPAWEAAYQSHVEQQRYDEASTRNTMHANMLNGQAVLSTDTTTTLPDTILLKAFISKSQRKELLDTAVFIDTTTSMASSSLAWQPAGAYKHKNLVPVRSIRAVVRDDDDNNNRYTVEVVLQPSNQGTATTTTTITILTGVPREALVFVDAPMAGPQFQRQGFRHPLGFPDELFPAAWRDLATTTTTASMQ